MNLYTIPRLMKNPEELIPRVKIKLARMHFVSDEMALRLLYSAKLGKKLNLDHPRSFNEKLQWLKLHNHNPLYTLLVDKYEVKRWVSERIGEQYVVPTYGVWNRFDEIDFSTLPECFVLKCTHDSGGIAICRDRATFDIKSARQKIERSLKRNYYWMFREWPYKDVRPRIIAEEYIDPSDGSNDLADYKLFRFTDGRIVTLVCRDRSLGEGMSKTFFDEDWRAFDFSEGGHSVDICTPKPNSFNVMCRAAEMLGHDMPFVRVDFYESSHGPLFGEMTFYPNAGFERFDPPEWDETFGGWVDLSGLS